MGSRSGTIEAVTAREVVAMAVAAPPFAGFSPDAVQFLADLSANNDRAWFHAAQGGL
jgi:hypothetical protein